jgi:putative spermidine/putrescine transport system permease protein
MNLSWKTLQPYVLIAPQTIVLFLFLVLPIMAIAAVSFWDFNGYTMSPAFTFSNYQSIFTSGTTLSTYINTFKFGIIVWLTCLLISYPVAYFLSFHIKNSTWQTIWFLVCTVPFLTSNIIRMISWVPFLGREGVVNQVLMNLHVVDQPLEKLLFSDFAVILAMVHLYALFMVAPIFNSMMRIDRTLIAAAEDLGASALEIQKNIILPLSAPGIAIGTIFIVTLVMGEFATVQLMGGGQVASVGKLIKSQIGSLQYPLAAANAVVLLAVTLILVFGILRTVDIRKEL